MEKTRVDGMKTGFTLIELMVTVSIVGILLAVGVPNFLAFLQNNRMVAQTNDVVTMLGYARSEAIKRNLPVTVCSSANNTSCAGATSWETGFIAFVDNDGNGAVGAGEQVLQVRQAIEGGNTLRSNNLTFTRYLPNGFSNSPGGTLRLCDARGTASGRAIVVSLLGRVRTDTLAAGGLACP